MKQLLLALIVITFSPLIIFSQITEKEEDLKTVSKDSTDGWEKGGIFSFTFGQTNFTNWAAGGINSISVNGLSSLFANYKKKNLTWDNSIDLGYGFQKQGKGDDSQILKTDDKFDFASKLGIKASNKIYYAALLNFKTQFAEGFNYPDDSTVISTFLAPAYLLGALGIDYKPNKSFTVFIAPITSKTTIVNNQVLADSASFGVEPGKNIRNEFGGYIKTVFTKEVIKNVSLTTKLDLFSNYINNPQNIDVNWEVLISMKINKFITANISTQLLYDHDIDIMVDRDNDGIMDPLPSKRIQFKEIFGIGFSFKF